MASWDNDDGFDGQLDHQEITSTTDRMALAENTPTSSTVSQDGSYEDSLSTAPQSASLQSACHPANFRVRLDVRQFKPNEVQIQHDGRMVSVHGKHEERSDDHGFISREFTRKYEIPCDVDPDKMTGSWHPNNVLIIKAPRDSAQSSLENMHHVENLPLPDSVHNNLHLDV